MFRSLCSRMLGSRWHSSCHEIDGKLLFGVKTFLRFGGFSAVSMGRFLCISREEKRCKSPDRVSVKVHPVMVIVLLLRDECIPPDIFVWDNAYLVFGVILYDCEEVPFRVLPVPDSYSCLFSELT